MIRERDGFRALVFLGKGGRRLCLAWVLLGLGGALWAAGCAPSVPRYRVVRVNPEMEGRLRVAQTLMTGGKYSEAIEEYEWVFRNAPDHPSAQEAGWWAWTLRRLVSLQIELAAANEELAQAHQKLAQAQEKLAQANERLTLASKEVAGLKQKGAGLQEDKQKLKAEMQQIQMEIQKLKDSYIRLEKLERDLKQGK